METEAETGGRRPPAQGRTPGAPRSRKRREGPSPGTSGWSSALGHPDLRRVVSSTGVGGQGAMDVCCLNLLVWSRLLWLPPQTYPLRWCGQRPIAVGSGSLRVKPWPGWTTRWGPGTPCPWTLRARGLIHWTTREVPVASLLLCCTDWSPKPRVEGRKLKSHSWWEGCCSHIERRARKWEAL